MDKIYKIFSLTNLTLLTALTLSTIAAWYSILGLTAIFAAAVVPIIIMGGALEVSKVVTTVWLHKYWNKVKLSMRMYLVVAVIALAFLTSMGIFGFLSKAHSDQNLVSGDVQSKIAIYDEKIKIAKENIDANRAALKQLDAAVDQIMGRSTTESGAERSVQIRRQQAPERQRLIREIEVEQKKINNLNEERAPIAAEVRKVEAEVGPIKYIAALIYGDNPEANLLERAVRWVIILIVFVFDPLALTLVLAANSSRDWDKDIVTEKSHTLIVKDSLDTTPDSIKKSVDDDIDKPIDTIHDIPDIPDIPDNNEKQEIKQVFFKKPWVDKIPGILFPPQIYRPNYLDKQPEVNIIEHEKNEIDVGKEPLQIKKVNIETENITKEKPVIFLDNGYVKYDGKTFQENALRELNPELFSFKADFNKPLSTNFGIEFPKYATKGDIFIRVDQYPNKVFKFSGVKWIEINKDISSTYLYDKEYIKYLIEKIDSGQYDVELLSENEKAQIEEYLKNQNT